jgi:hypothetical protein
VKSASTRLHLLLIFLVSPFISLVLAFNTKQTRVIGLLIWLFVGFYGFNYVLNRNADYDIVRYVERFEKIPEKTNSIPKIFMSLYTEEGVVDIVEPLIRLLVSYISDNYRYLILAFALTLGFFYSRNITYMLKSRTQDFSYASIIVLLGFSLVVTANDITVFRWMSASQVFLLGVFVFFIDERKSLGFFVASLSMLFHFTFINAIIFFLIYIIIGEKRNLIFIFFILSFFFSSLNLEFFRSYLELLPGVAEEKYSAYLMDKEIGNVNVQRFESNISFHALYYIQSLNIFIIALVYWLHTKLPKEKTIISNLFYFSVFFFAVYNILDFIQSVHRFTFFARMIILAAIFLFIQAGYKKRETRTLITYLSPFLLFFIIVKFRMLLEFMGPSTIISNPLFAAFISDEESLITFIKGIF